MLSYCCFLFHKNRSRGSKTAKPFPFLFSSSSLAFFIQVFIPLFSCMLQPPGSSLPHPEVVFPSPVSSFLSFFLQRPTSSPSCFSFTSCRFPFPHPSYLRLHLLPFRYLLFPSPSIISSVPFAFPSFPL